MSHNVSQKEVERQTQHVEVSSRNRPMVGHLYIKQARVGSIPTFAHKENAKPGSGQRVSSQMVESERIIHLCVARKAKHIVGRRFIGAATPNSGRTADGKETDE